MYRSQYEILSLNLSLIIQFSETNIHGTQREGAVVVDEHANKDYNIFRFLTCQPLLTINQNMTNKRPWAEVTYVSGCHSYLFDSATYYGVQYSLGVSSIHQYKGLYLKIWREKLTTKADPKLEIKDYATQQTDQYSMQDRYPQKSIMQAFSY